MTYKIAFKKSVSRDLKKIGKEQIERILSKIEENLVKTPKQCPLLSGKFAGLRKLRVGDYRVIFTILDDTVLILRVSHRKESYKKI
ncbi:MAG: type II toxin-antitoxin system RelE/ParE family toxin [Deltaproteobacteria bacterium]|nr:type II toxin-antitoxin system RelE/ParE family toxin [Deltaproteobacteria bacterium]